ncbi:MAG: hypothetical protein PHD02_04400 [Bacilli bacterium]|nr:hypothetical protein [Bacilli bacterium]
MKKIIRVGDVISFYKRLEEKQIVRAKAIKIKYYKTLLEMYTDNFDKDFKDKYKIPIQYKTKLGF